MLPTNLDGDSRISDFEWRQPFRPLFDRIDPVAAAKVTIALTRLEQGNDSNVRSVGSGVFELRINFGPGYRIYFDRENDTLLILLGGGTKKLQQRDITAAQGNWQDYKRRMKGGI